MRGVEIGVFEHYGLSMRRAVIDAIWPLASVMIGILVAMNTAEHVKVRFE